MSQVEVPVVFARWETFTVWLFERTAGFPKRLRASLTQRVENCCLDVFQSLVVARYSKESRADALANAATAVDQLRLLLRLAARLGCMSHQQGRHCAEQLDEVGRMVGGWRRSLT